jgi:hypothetical protein
MSVYKILLPNYKKTHKMRLKIINDKGGER